VSPTGPTGPTCSDSIRNGSETDVDCGGTCPRCANGKVCGNRNDCATAFCAGGACQDCEAANCPDDANGDCECNITVGADPGRACAKRGVGNNSISTSSCGECPAGRLCVQSAIGVECRQPCGAPLVCPSGTKYCTIPNSCQQCCSNVDCCGQNFCPPGTESCLAGGTCGI
jgi:hypothetical protein